MGTIIRFSQQEVKVVNGGNMEAQALRTDIIRPALKITNLWSMAAENLLLGTALVESELKVIKQFGGGPGMSYYQIESATYTDMLRYLNLRQTKIRDLILTACYMETFPEASALLWNLRLATLIARVRYYVEPTPLPDANDIKGLGEYWVKYYHRGNNGTVQEYIQAWETYA